MIFGKSQAKFYVKSTDLATTYDTITLTNVNRRSEKSFENRIALKYTNPFTLSTVDVFRGYRLDETLYVTAPDFPSSQTLTQYDAVQVTSYENDVSKLVRVQEWFDQGYAIIYVPRTDAEGTPWFRTYQVECQLLDFGRDNIYSDQIAIRLTGVDITDAFYNSAATEPTNTAATLDVTCSAGTPDTTVIAVSWTSAAAVGPVFADGSIIIRRKTSAVTYTPVDGVIYTVGQDLGSNQFVVLSSDGDSGSFNDTGLEHTTTYYYKIWSYNGSGYRINYSTVTDTDNRTTGTPA